MPEDGTSDFLRVIRSYWRHHADELEDSEWERLVDEGSGALLRVKAPSGNFTAGENFVDDRFGGQGERAGSDMLPFSLSVSTEPTRFVATAVVVC